MARGVGATSVQAGLGQASCQGLFAGSSKFTMRHLGSRLTWNMSFAKERETRIAAALECVANVGRFLECASQRQLKKCNVFKATSRVCALLQARMGALQRMDSSR